MMLFFGIHALPCLSTFLRMVNSFFFFFLCWWPVESNKAPDMKTHQCPSCPFFMWVIHWLVNIESEMGDLNLPSHQNTLSWSLKWLKKKKRDSHHISTLLNVFQCLLWPPVGLRVTYKTPFFNGSILQHGVLSVSNSLECSFCVHRSCIWQSCMRLDVISEQVGRWLICIITSYDIWR